jgi:regulator of nucleoside diphosphate kinase
MQSTVNGARTLTELDYTRLLRFNEGAAPELRDCLSQADLVSSREIPGNVVTMHSQVEVLDLATGKQSKVAICYPADAEPAAGFISALSPFGASLLGLEVGAIARWRTPAGLECAARVAAVLFQPEASGDYTL